MSKKYLIVNADDFGYSYSINRGIIEAHTQGTVISTSVMVDAIAAHEAKELARLPNLSIGLHFELKEIKHVKVELDRQIQKFVALVGNEPDYSPFHSNPENKPNAEAINAVPVMYQDGEATYPLCVR